MRATGSLASPRAHGRQLLTMDPAALEAYMLRFTGLCEELRAFARRHGATYVRMRTDEPLEPVVRRFVGRSVD